MKLKLVFLLYCAGALSAHTLYSQQVTFDVAYQDKTLAAVFAELKSITGYNFTYDKKVVDESERVTVTLKEVTLEQVLEQVLLPKGYRYVVDNNIVFIGAIEQKPNPQVTFVNLTGTVRDNDKRPLPGVTVLIKGTTRGVSTDADGRYIIPVRLGDILSFTFVGMQSQEVAYTGQQEIDVVMQEDREVIGEVIVTGIFNRPKESFTGAATIIRKEELKTSSSQGLISAISNVDPSFKFVKSNLFGSDPNKITSANITIRGTTALMDYQNDLENALAANRPLFVIDGFVSTLEQFVALDDSRVESVLVLKDASATALYGTEAANGVVVVTTSQPEQGRLRVVYRGIFALEAPDLSTYDLMNAREKLQYELEAGLYDVGYVDGNQEEMTKYYARKLDVERGVDTDWLHYPVRAAFSHNHSLTLSGGERSIRYAIDLNNNRKSNTMKGSYRNTFNGGMYLHYKVNAFVFSNRLSVTNVYAPNSHYGSFSRYTQMNAYWAPYDTNGNPIMILDPNYYPAIGYGGGTAPGGVEEVRRNSLNPLWNASLPSKDESRYTSIQNNFQAEWKMNDYLTSKMSFSYTHSKNRTDIFKSPDHTDFSAYTGDNLQRKGNYYFATGQSSDYAGSLQFSYSKVFAERHSLLAGINGRITQSKSEEYNFTVEGMTVNTFDFLPVASMYEKDGKPGGRETIVRRLSGSTLFNYTFDGRYYADFVFSLSGSSEYGSANRTAPTGSLGLGWNLHREEFMHNQSVFNTAVFKGSFGYVGSAGGYNAYDALRMYDLVTTSNYRGNFGMRMYGLGNPELKWQLTEELNIGTDLTMFNSRVQLTFNWYNNTTKDLITPISIPTASGMSQYKANIGRVRNRGFEIDLSLRLIRDREREFEWTVRGSARQNKNKILEIGDYLNSFNENANSTDGLGYHDANAVRRNPVFLYREGESMNTLFAVPSKGIDPATGKEIYVKLDGTETFTWNTEDQRSFGTTDATLWGSFSSSWRWKGLTLTAWFQYTTGSYQYNSTLANKVENIYPYMNADRRALTSRWKKPGDVTSFKSVKDRSSTNATSRFIMKENTLQCTSINLQYTVPRAWAKKNLGMEFFELQANMEDVFYCSSIKRERGTFSPFANNFSLTVRITY